MIPEAFSHPLVRIHGEEVFNWRMFRVLCGIIFCLVPYVMPDFFAHKIPKREAVKLIWPQDGALASPVTLLVKAKRAAAVKRITDYLTGEALARVFAGACFPSPHPGVDNPLPAGAGLNWLGWDYIRANDLETINAEIDQVFLPAVQQRGGS